MTTKLLHYFILIISSFYFISCSSLTYNLRGNEIYNSKRIGVLKPISIIEKSKKHYLNIENAKLIENRVVEIVNKNNIALKINSDTSVLYTAYDEIFEMENLLNKIKDKKDKKRFLSEFKFSDDFYMLLEKNNLDQLVLTVQEGFIISDLNKNATETLQLLPLASPASSILGLSMFLNKNESNYKTWIVDRSTKSIIYRNVVYLEGNPLSQKPIPLYVCYLFDDFLTIITEKNSCFIIEN